MDKICPLGHYGPQTSLKQLLKVMKVTAFLLFLCIFSAHATGIRSQNAKVTIQKNNVSLEEILNEIERQTDYLFVYTDNVNVKEKTSLHVTSAKVSNVLQQLLAGKQVAYSMEGNHIVLSAEKQGVEITLQSANITVKGSVVDETGMTMPGANVVVKGNSGIGTVTDIDGNFALDVPKGSTLIVSFIGYKNIEVAAVANKSLVVKLVPDAEALDEVVVVGFGTQKKVNLTGSVSVVSSKEIEQRPVANLTQALQGMVPGLQITQTNGSLEDTPSINVRGTTTIGQGTSGGPLVLIDGVEGDLNSVAPQDVANISVLKDAAASSIYGSRAPFGVILITTKSGSKEGKVSINYNNSFRIGSPVNMNHMMNSIDFASWMNDAETNGGGGVYFSTDRMKQIVEYRNAKPCGPGQRITEDGRILYSISDRGDGSNLWQDGYAYGINDVDYFDVIYKKHVFSQEHNFSLSGGSNKLNYYASFNYLDQGGFMNLGEEGLKRYNAMLKVNSELTDWLRFNYSIRYVRKDYKRPSRLTNNIYYRVAVQGWPVLPVYDRNGYLYSSPSPALALAEGGTDRLQDDNIYNQASFVIEPIKNWLTHIDFTYRTYINDRHWDTQQLFNHNANGDPVVKEDASHVHEGFLKDNYYNFSVYTEYSHLFKESHDFHIMAGFQAEELKNKSYGLQRDGIMLSEKSEVDMTTGLGPDGTPIPPSVYGYQKGWATAGFFGRLNYHYKNKYLFEGNIRADGSSRFRSHNRWGVFPSVSLGWNIANEEFFKPLNDVVNLLKLRASIGSLGNQNTTDWYQTYQKMGIGSSNGSWLMGNKRPNTASAPGLVAENLTWETIQTTNFALDWGLLSNRLTGSVEYYIRDTKDMVGYAPELPSILGTDVPVTNNTDLRTMGWELSIGWRDRLKNGLNYGVNFNISDVRTKITRYPNNPTNYIESYIEGRYLGEIWGFTTKGLARTDEEMQAHLATLPNGGQDALGSDWKAGDIMYADINGDGKISKGSEVIGDLGDLHVIGNDLPRYLFGLDLNASWKGFDVRAFFQGVMKRDIWNGSRNTFGTISSGRWYSAGIEAVSDYFRNEDSWSVKEGYTQKNIDAFLPRPLYSGKNMNKQTRYLQNAAYIRLKNLQVGYTIPVAITSRWGIQNLRVFFSGENLWTKSGVYKQFDPETITGGDSGVGYPLSRTVSFGLNITL